MLEEKKKRDLFRSAFLRKKPVIRRRSTFLAQSPFGWGTFFLWFLFGGTVLYVLFFSPWLEINTVVLKGESIIPSETLTDFVWGMLRGKYLHLLPKDNLLLAPRKSIQKALLEEYPKFHSVRIVSLFPHTLRVEVSEEPYLILWCSGGPCSLVGPQGVMLSSEQAGNPLYTSSILSIIDKSALPVTRGEKVPLDAYITNIIYLEKNFSEKTGLTLERVAETPTRYAGELRFMTSAGFALLINTEEPPEETLATVVSLLSTLTPTEHYKDLTSMDLRIPGRAFLGFKNSIEEIPAPASNSSSPESTPPVKKEEKPKH